MNNLKLPLSLLFIALPLGNKLFAQDFVYEPKNPAFGGNTFNYQWMLSSAQAQNTIEEESDDPFNLGADRDPLQDFQESLNRQILSQLSRQLVANQFGTSGSLEPGEYLVGNYQITVSDVLDGVSIVILDTSTGNQTTVVIPFQ